VLSAAEPTVVDAPVAKPRIVFQFSDILVDIQSYAVLQKGVATLNPASCITLLTTCSPTSPTRLSNVKPAIYACKAATLAVKPVIVVDAPVAQISRAKH
jgi:hypothetical protein